MNVLVVAPQPFFQPRGTPIAVRMLVETLVEGGHEVDLLVFHEGQDVLLRGARIYRSASLPFVKNVSPGFSMRKVACDIAMAIKVARMAFGGRYDVIHAVEEASFIARGLRWLTQTPYVFDMDSSMPQQVADKHQAARPFLRLMNALEAWAIRGSDAVVVMCKTLQDRVLEVDAAKPVLRLEDVSMLDDTEVEEDLRQDFSIDGPMIMYVGNLERYQGIDLLIDAFQLVYESGAAAHLMIIGGSNAHIAQYQAEVARRGMSDRVHFAGPRPLEHLGAYLRQADLLVSPRIHGTNTPMKVYSYLDSGRPVVATRKETHTQVLDEDIAVLADPTPEAMAEAMQQLISDRELGARLAGNARRRVAQEFSPEAFQRKLIGFYELLECGLPARAEKYNDTSLAAAGQ